MSERLIIDGNAVYEIDEDCMMQQNTRAKTGGQRRRRGEWPNGNQKSCREQGKENS